MLCLSNFPTLQLFNLGSLHHLPQPAAHPAQNPGAVGGVDRLWTAVADAVLHETHGRGIDGAGHGIDEPPDLLWNSDARRQLQFLADVLGAPAQQRAPPGAAAWLHTGARGHSPPARVYPRRCQPAPPPVPAPPASAPPRPTPVVPTPVLPVPAQRAARISAGSPERWRCR